MLNNNLKVLLQKQLSFSTVAAAAVKPKPKRTTKPSLESKGFIVCKRTELNLLEPLGNEHKFGTVPLASKGWLHYKAMNDFFTIKRSAHASERLPETESLIDFSSRTTIKLEAQLLENLTNNFEITQLTSIQTQAIPKIYEGQHVLLAAETGCGKTMAYLLPIVQQLLERKQKEERRMNTPLAVILTPGRELATQIGGVAEQLCANTPLNVKTVLGGNTKQLMMNPEFANVDILVATIGALSKLVTTGIYRMEAVKHVVLDEADSLLDDTFADKVCHFLKRFPFHKQSMQDAAGTQLVLVSATMPTNTNEILSNIIDVETLQQVVSPRLHRLLSNVEQRFLRMSKINRPATLLRIVKTELEKRRPIIIFSNKSASSDYVSIFLNNSNVNCLNLNGDMLMKIRLGRFQQFQNEECDVLSTTDVASRGLDTTRARHIINFDFPLHMSDYIHRCGRIGRVGSNEHCIISNLISSRREVDVVQRIEHAARTGGILPGVNANIKNIINKRILNDMQTAGIPLREDNDF